MFCDRGKALPEDKDSAKGFELSLSLSLSHTHTHTHTPAHPQRTITTFFSPITPTNATSQSRDTQMGPRLGHKKGVTIDRAIENFPCE